MELILHGIGIYTMMASMPMYSLLILIRYGGIGGGIGVWPDLAGAGVGAGVHLIIIVGILRTGTAVGTIRSGDRDGEGRTSIMLRITDGQEIIV